MTSLRLQCDLIFTLIFYLNFQNTFNHPPASHSPRTMPLEETYASRELEKYFVDQSKAMFEAKTKPSLLLATQVGNMYTASVYSCLVSHLVR